MTNLLNTTLFGEYSIKEMTEQEFQSRTHHQREYKSLTNLLGEIVSNTKKEDMPSIKEKVEKILSRVDEISRSFGVYLGDEYVGYVSFVNYDSKNPEIQIELSEAHRGRGIGFRALSLLINLIFEEKQDVEYFLYRVRVDNIASIRLIEKLGGKKIETGHFVEQIISRYHIYKSR